MTPLLKQILEGAPEEYNPWLTNQRAKAVEFSVRMNKNIRKQSKKTQK